MLGSPLAGGCRRHVVATAHHVADYRDDLVFLDPVAKTLIARRLIQTPNEQVRLVVPAYSCGTWGAFSIHFHSNSAILSIARNRAMCPLAVADDIGESKASTSSQVIESKARPPKCWRKNWILVPSSRRDALPGFSCNQRDAPSSSDRRGFSPKR